MLETKTTIPRHWLIGQPLVHWPTLGERVGVTVYDRDFSRGVGIESRGGGEGTKRKILFTVLTIGHGWRC